MFEYFVLGYVIPFVIGMVIFNTLLEYSKHIGLIQCFDEKTQFYLSKLWVICVVPIVNIFTAIYALYSLGTLIAAQIKDAIDDTYN